MDTEFKDPILQKWVAKSKKEMPFDDFEEHLMMKIYKEHKRKLSIGKDIALTWIFFVLGMAAGIVLVLTSGLMKNTFPETRINMESLSIIVISCFVALVFLEKLINISFTKRRDDSYP